MVRRGNTPKPFVLTITRTEALIAIAVDEDLVLEHRGEQIAGDLPGGRHPLSIGGYLSRLSLGPVSIVDLGSTRVPGVPETP